MYISRHELHGKRWCGHGYSSSVAHFIDTLPTKRLISLGLLLVAVASMRDLPAATDAAETDIPIEAASSVPVLLPGTRVDVLDTVGKWMQAIIAEVDRSACLIHYCSWTCQWDEVLTMDSPRIAPLGTHTCTLLSASCSASVCWLLLAAHFVSRPCFLLLMF